MRQARLRPHVPGGEAVLLHPQGDGGTGAQDIHVPGQVVGMAPPVREREMAEDVAGIPRALSGLLRLRRPGYGGGPHNAAPGKHGAVLR